MLFVRLAAVLVTAGLLIENAAATEPKISFTRQIKPILSSKCFACHGPDEKERKAELRLDVRDEAVPGVIKPGDGEHSEVVVRILTGDADARMPPADSKKPAVTPAEAQLIQRWIDQGAEYDAHWAYVKPTRPAVPAVKAQDWPTNPIDNFILARLEVAGLSPAPEADPRTLLRRLSFDLVGLPPAQDQFEKLVRDNHSPLTTHHSPDSAYEAAVDRLLASQHFGERMALYWLDVVRYADTGGYHSDNHRDVWAYRDYVIAAFNDNKPFDQFTIEQLAGDLLPGATDQQRIASGYNRLLQTTEEGGAQPKEYAAKYSADRVRNTSVIWLASTMGCCECHTHKFDPFTIKDFYSFAAFFADVSEKAVGRQDQTKLPTPEQAAQLKALDELLAVAKAELSVKSPELAAARATWEAVARETPPKGLAAPVLAALKEEPPQRSAKQEELLDVEFRKQAPELATAREKVAGLEKERAAIDATILSTLVSMSVSPRPTRILARGNWLDDSGDVVLPAIPSFLSSSASVQGSGSETLPKQPENRLSRLDLARWIASQDNSLTARVFVNRLWKLAFGRGIVKSLEDFGSQGELPTHPELLDWLATDFIDNGWDVKRTLKLMLMSRAYRQSSAPTKEALAKDPTNDLFSRQNRFRLDAEMIRDNALAVSGLLVHKIGGPSVKPYQPAGYWQYLNFPKREWENDRGESQYRRGLYTYWQRTFLHPSLAAFDASSREECTVDRPRSNTPQQALVLLNDPTYVEAARALAGRVLEHGGTTTNERLRYAIQQVLTRQPHPAELETLASLLANHRAEFAADQAAAEKLLTVGDLKSSPSLDPAELAAWTSACRVLLNLHETITRN
jgi:Protein of unknown function (DUF1553)/Protein of unknown function (DUF1549)/Planctomycete cytochrome C